MSFFLTHPKGKDLYGIFNDSFPPILDGVTLTVENYARWISESGRTPCIVTPWNPEKVVSPYSVMRFLSLPIHNRKPYRYGYPKLDPFIWRRLRETNFRILHSHCPFSSGRLAVYVKKHQNVPLIGTFHSKYKSDLKHSFKIMPFCVPIIMKRILNFFNACDEVWIPQAQVEETLREYGFKGSVTVVENGIDLADVIKGDVAEYKNAAKKKLNFSSDDLNILFVGQLIWEKGIDIILEVLENLSPRTGIKMNFIGKGYASSRLESLVKKKNLSDIVTINGVITDREHLSDFYAASDLFLFPSLYDNAPLVVREAASMATPSILLEGSTASEVVTHEKNGFITDKNPKEIADLIISLSKNREKLLNVGINARNSLVRSWEDVVGEVIDRYEVIIRNYKN